MILLHAGVRQAPITVKVGFNGLLGGLYLSFEVAPIALVASQVKVHLSPLHNLVRDSKQPK